MLSVKVDARRAVERTRAMMRGRADARATALRRMLAPALLQLVREAPKDTGRFARGWAQAANAVGVGPVSVPRLRPSRFTEQWTTRLQQQYQYAVEWFEAMHKNAERWRRIWRDRYGSGKRRGKWAADARKKLRAAEALEQKSARHLARAKEERDKLTATSVVIFGGKGRRLKITVRPVVYGGTGTVVDGDGKTTFVLHNREPHSSIVQARRPLVGAMVARLKGAGVRVGRAGYLGRIKSRN